MGPCHPLALPQANVSLPPNQRGDTLAGRWGGGGGSQLGRLEKKPSSLSALRTAASINRAVADVGVSIVPADAGVTAVAGVPAIAGVTAIAVVPAFVFFSSYSSMKPITLSDW